jgi:hypothetical protein
MRKRLHQLVERQVKLRGWRRLALLGVGDSRTLVHLLGTCPYLEILAVDDFASAIPRNREAWRAKARRTAEAYASRCLLREVTPLEAAGLMVGTVDAAVLDLDAAALAAWAPHVTGAFMGTDWNHSSTRAWLTAHRPGWTKLEGGAWLSRAAQPMQEAA